MAETEQVAVAEVSDGFGSVGDPGAAVSLPVVELLTGRGFATGKSGAGKSNSISVIAEKLLDNGFGLLIVDIDGEYYGLKEAYELLHVGADEECDIQVTAEHADKLATLALERNVPIILDVSSYLDESEAEAVLTAVAQHLFAKAKKQKQPFLLIVEEIHEYIPEQGSVGEAGKMLIKIGKRGRKHGLGIVGISQRPADVKKDYITQCDWLLWHRLTWDNDTNVVRRMLDGEHASAVEELADGEGFLMTDWAETERVQFYRKQTFDAGATPGLDDFERPELKSVSDELVAELDGASENNDTDESDRIADLRTTLEEKNSRIAELERELKDAQDLRRMAAEFVDALVQHVEGAAPGRTGQERMQTRLRSSNEPERADDDADTAGPAPAAGGESSDGRTERSNGHGSAFSAAAIFETLSAASDLSIDAVERRDGSPLRDRLAAGQTELRLMPTTTADDDANTQDAPEDLTPASANQEPVAVRERKAEISGLETLTRQMLSVYYTDGPMKPTEVHAAAGGDGDRKRSYARNRALRTRGLINHVGQGYYDDRLRAVLREDDGLAEHNRIDQHLQEIERVALGED
jgi:Predicted ATPase